MHMMLVQYTLHCDAVIEYIIISLRACFCVRYLKLHVAVDFFIIITIMLSVSRDVARLNDMLCWFIFS